MKKRWPALVLLAALALLPLRQSRADITSVTLTPAPTTMLSNGQSYYLAGIPYVFRVQAFDPEATVQTDWNQITVEFRTLAGIQQSFAINMNDDSITAQNNVIVTVANNTTDWRSPDYDITVYFRWDMPNANEFAPAATNFIRLRVSEDLAPPSSLVQDVTFSYGVCASVAVLNFAQGGDAADGYVNPNHAAFNVTGAIVYNVPLATIADRVEARDGGEITGVGTTLLLDGNPSVPPLTDNTMADDCSYTINSALGWLTGAAAVHIWRIQCRMATGPVDEVSNNLLNIYCNEVQVTNVEFINGGGRTISATEYYRSVNFPGTQVRVTANLVYGGGAMVGNTNITLNNGVDPVTIVQIVNGATQGVGNVNYPGGTVDGTTTPRTYQISQVSGGVYDTQTTVTQPANRIVYWDDVDPPGVNGVTFLGPPGPPLPVLDSTTAYSLTLIWTPLTHPLDGDFDTYRIYYRTSATGPIPAGPWLMLDRTSGGVYTTLGNYGTGTITIDGLNPLTEYDYYMSAVDIFGNVVDNGNEAPYSSATPRTVVTQYKTIECTLTDGERSYPDAHFAATKAGASRPVRKTAIKVTFFLVTAGGQPDSNSLILMKGDYNVKSTLGSNEFILEGTNTIRSGVGYVLNTDYYRIPCMKTAPNTWVGYIPETNPFMQYGNTLSFMLETTRGGAVTYSDSSKSETTPVNPNNEKWAFNVGIQNVFTPWPTRVLNNVITKKNPVAYPSFYLSENALVTIRIYDIKGRPVMTLLDNSPRAGGQNIAEGWAGVNRYNNKVGVGLYYIHIQARSAASGKIILNSFKKVVVAK